MPLTDHTVVAALRERKSEILLVYKSGCMELLGLWSIDNEVTPTKGKGRAGKWYMNQSEVSKGTYACWLISYLREQVGFCSPHFVQTKYQCPIYPQPCIFVTWESQTWCVHIDKTSINEKTLGDLICYIGSWHKSLN